MLSYQDHKLYYMCFITNRLDIVDACPLGLKWISTLGLGSALCTFKLAKNLLVVCSIKFGNAFLKRIYFYPYEFHNLICWNYFIGWYMMLSECVIFLLWSCRFRGVFQSWREKRAEIRCWELRRWEKDKNWIFEEKSNKCIY